MNVLTTLHRYRELLWLWTVREVRVRYKQSILGFAWAILQPLALTAVFTVVFSRFVRIDTGGIPYPVFAYAALLPWTLFATSLTFGIPSLVNNMNLVTKIYFPREVLPLANVGAAFIDFLAASVVFAGLLLIYGVSPGVQALWIIPLLAVQVVLTVGVTLLGSAVIVFFRDVRFVVPLLIQVWMYACPIIYPVDMVPESLRPYYFLNPMAGLIDGYRRVLVNGQPPDWAVVGVGTAVAAVVFVLGYALFKWAEPLFADLI